MLQGSLRVAFTRITPVDPRPGRHILTPRSAARVPDTRAVAIETIRPHHLQLRRLPRRNPQRQHQSSAAFSVVTRSRRLMKISLTTWILRQPVKTTTRRSYLVIALVKSAPRVARTAASIVAGQKSSGMRRVRLSASRRSGRIDPTGRTSRARTTTTTRALSRTTRRNHGEGTAAIVRRLYRSPAM